MSFFFFECRSRISQLKDDNKFIRSIVDYKLNKFENYDKAEIELESQIEGFKIREGLD